MAGAIYDHIDLRVRDIRGVSRFYDALMREFGLTKISRDARTRTYYQPDRREPFFGLTQARTHKPNLARIAFAAQTRADVQRVAAVVRRAGGKEVSGPETIYTQPYYAVFFEDPEGNKLEVCCRR